MKQSLFITTAQQKILEVLLRFPEREFTLTELSALAGVRKQNSATLVNTLTKNNLALQKRIGRLWRIRANTEHQHFQQIKKVYNLYAFYESGLLEELKKQHPHPRAILLFGSYSRGDDESTSDIDIAIELDSKQDYEIRTIKSKTLKKTIQLHLFHRTKIDKNLFSTIANGTLLTGFLEVQQ
ncbi:MAG: nucleotidyltransferase domain-containing protein [Deltaproteobacteria bacterium]